MESECCRQDGGDADERTGAAIIADEVMLKAQYAAQFVAKDAEGHHLSCRSRS